MERHQVRIFHRGEMKPEVHDFSTREQAHKWLNACLWSEHSTTIERFEMEVFEW